MEIAKTWVLEHQEESGDWLGIQPAMVYSILALLVLGHGISSEPIKKGLKATERFTIESEEELMLQSCISPVWDTALTSLALCYSGIDRVHPALVRAVEWLSTRQVSKKGDWSVSGRSWSPGDGPLSLKTPGSLILMILLCLDAPEPVQGYGPRR